MTTVYGYNAKKVLDNNCEGYDVMNDGEQFKFNHTDCDMGEDTKQRLYVRKSDGAYLWHCHNCGDSGYYRNKELETIASRGAGKIEHGVVDAIISEYIIATVNFADYPLEQQVWLLQYEFDPSMTAFARIRSSNKGIFIPIFQDGKMNGYQIRQFNRSPKYLTKTSVHYSYNCGTIMNDSIILTEDLLSAIKLNKIGYSTMALLGTKLHSEALDEILRRKYKQVLIWLDEDIAGEKAAKDLFKELTPIIVGTRVMKERQPKEIPFSRLEQMILF